MKILLPKMLPNTRSFSPTNKTADPEVNNSGRLVTAASNTPPIKAPEILVFLSNKSTKSPSFIDK